MLIELVLLTRNVSFSLPQEVKMLIVQLQSCSRIKDQEIYLQIGKNM